MKDYAPIPEDEKWQAVVNNDMNFDGLFFYGVKTTGVFCRPSCRAKTPIRRNTMFFSTAEQAVREGFRPCKLCRPDIEIFNPAFELVKAATELLCNNYQQPITLPEVAKQLGVSSAHLARLFKIHLGLTTAQYLSKLRIKEAARLLINTNDEILDVAYLAGFKSISAFYMCFKEQQGCSPKEYRIARGNKNANLLL